MSESTEAASFFVDSRTGLHPMSPGWCTFSHVSYATQPRYCRNYALKIYDARRNRRNAPSVARFSLPCHPWQGISVYRVHNSTVSRQLRYSLTREYIRQPFVENEAPSYCHQKRKQPPSSRPKIASYNLHFTTILAHKPFFYSFLIKIHTFSYIFY